MTSHRNVEVLNLILKIVLSNLMTIYDVAKKLNIDSIKFDIN